MSNSQISVALYPVNIEAGTQEYLYSKSIPTEAALTLVSTQLKNYDLGNKKFFTMDRKEGPIYIRFEDIKTILVKEADERYA